MPTDYGTKLKRIARRPSLSRGGRRLRSQTPLETLSIDCKNVQSYNPPREKYVVSPVEALDNTCLLTFFSEVLFGPAAATVPPPPEIVFTFSPWSSPKKRELASKPPSTTWTTLDYLTASVDKMAEAMACSYNCGYQTKMPADYNSPYDFLWGRFMCS
jgi:hypothetical protein